MTFLKARSVSSVEPAVAEIVGRLSGCEKPFFVNKEDGIIVKKSHGESVLPFVDRILETECA